MILYINCCVRKESRTRRLAEYVLGFLKKQEEVVTVDLTKEKMEPLSEEKLKKRSEYAERNDFSDEMFSYAKLWANADKIVIAAPYWDLSFPSILKVFIENIYVVGLVASYDDMGRPIGLCRATDLYYVTTAGGPYKEDYGYGYIRDVVTRFFGIADTHLFCGKMLDVVGFDCETQLKIAKEEVDNFFAMQSSKEQEKSPMTIAVEEARIGIHKGHGGPFGAVVVKDGKVIATGHNRVLVDNDSTAHGEITAIRNAEKKLGTYSLEGCELYTTGEPCPMCLAACMWANLAHVYYGCSLEDNSRIGFRDSEFDEKAADRSKLKDFLSQTGREECLELFDEYNDMEKTLY